VGLSGLNGGSRSSPRLDSSSTSGHQPKPSTQNNQGSNSNIVKYAVLAIVGLFGFGAILTCFACGLNGNHQSSTSNPDFLPDRQTPPTNNPTTEGSSIVTTTLPPFASTSFEDLGADWCAQSTNDLKREDTFKRFNGKVVEWEGEVSHVGETFGSLMLQVKHCPNTLTSDIVITLRADQKQKAIDLKQGQMVKYRTKLSGWNSWTGLSGNDGVIISTRTKEAGEGIQASVDLCQQEYDATGDVQKFNQCLTLAKYRAGGM
jgi:hypothetical protein